MNAKDLKSRAGQLLYRELPEEYRYQDLSDADELGDLEAYLHGFGHLFDLIRGTTEQAYADAFAEDADNGLAIQTWLIPYLAELVGAQLRAPDPDARREELNNAVNWFKAKGTMEAVDQISDTISGAETAVVEGWRRTLTTPRMALPPFTADAAVMGSGDPIEAPGLPQGTPDIRRINRAVRDPLGANPLTKLSMHGRDEFGRETESEAVFWRPLSRNGAPCFQGAYDDTSVRTPDLRAPDHADIGPHPKRTLIHVRPPEGFFATGINGSRVAPTVADLGIDDSKSAEQVIRPTEIFGALGLLDEPQVDELMVDGQVVLPDRVIVQGDLEFPAGVTLRIEDLMFTGTLRISSADTRVTFNRCTIEHLVIDVASDDPLAIASDCLMNRVSGGAGFGQFVYCTVLGTVELVRLWASDCIFNDAITGLDCDQGHSCLRFTRVPDLDALADCAAGKSLSNTQNDPNFVRLWFQEGDGCVLRPAQFGEPGVGVLDLTSSQSIRAGAEDDGEMGAYHHRFHAAQIAALKLKLLDYLPLGQEIAIRYDPCLARLPVGLT